VVKVNCWVSRWSDVGRRSSGNEHGVRGIICSINTPLQTTFSIRLDNVVDLSWWLMIMFVEKILKFCCYMNYNSDRRYLLQLFDVFAVLCAVEIFGMNKIVTLESKSLCWSSPLEVTLFLVVALLYRWI
jgi:hypothetical protein